MTFWLHLAARLALGVFVLLTWAYAVATVSPFAYDMFIRPRLLPALSSFVAWHHLWYWAVYLIVAGSLVIDVIPGRSTGSARRTAAAARWLAVLFILVFGALGAHLAVEPYLPTLSGDGRGRFVALVALLPAVWVATIDHLAGWPALVRSPDDAATSQWRLLIVCSATAMFVWLMHLSGAGAADAETDFALRLAGGAWALALCATTLMTVYVLLNVVTAAAGLTGAPRAAEYVFIVGLVAVGISEVLRRIVLRAIAFDEGAALPVSALTGAVVAAQWSGLALRRASSAGGASRTGLDLLMAPGPRRLVPSMAALLLLPLLLHVTLQRADRFDWNFVIQKIVVLCAWTIAFALFVRISPAVRDRRWSVGVLAVPPALAIAALYAIPPAARWMAAGGEGAAVSSALDRYTSRDVALRLQSAALVRQPGVDPEYNRYLQQTAASSINGSTSLPRVEFSRSAPRPGSPRPHVFLFVIDSLRRDYVSLYNPAVDFTPELERFGRENFVFANAFTQYGGTWLSMPALWVGGAVARGWGGAPFHRVNALEQLILKDEYRLVINDYTVAGYLLKSTPRTFLQPEIPSVDTDLCTLLPDLEAFLDATTADPRPVLAYLAPMNVHLLNTRAGKVLSPGERYPGFYEPYASRLRRLDGCFGRFIASLKKRAIYENSIVVVTSDHGDSLGENGRWGHQFGLFPEHVRVPLIVHLPDALRATVTTDLGRVSFLSDVAPTLYELLGHDLEDAGPLFGTPLFVGRDRELAPRRRDSFLLMSSYGPTFGLLRRNGRFLYVSDIAEGRDFAFDLAASPLGMRVDVTPDVRYVNQRLIRDLVEKVNDFYDIHPAP